MVSDFSVFGETMNKATIVDYFGRFWFYNLDRAGEAISFKGSLPIKRNLEKFEDEQNVLCCGTPDAKLVLFAASSAKLNPTLRAYRVGQSGLARCMTYFPSKESVSRLVSLDCYFGKGGDPVIILSQKGLVRVVVLEEQDASEAQVLTVSQAETVRWDMTYGSCNVTRVGDDYFYYDYDQSGRFLVQVGVDVARTS